MRRLAGSALISLIVAGLVTPVMLWSAESKEFYTRKRIKGHWVQGYFQKKHSRKIVVRRAVRSVVQAAALPEPAETAPVASIFPFKLGLHFSPEPPPTSAQAGPQLVKEAEPGSEPDGVTTGSTKKTYSARQSRRAERWELRRWREAKRRETVARAVQKHERTALQVARLDTRGVERAEQHANDTAAKSSDVAAPSPTVSTQTSTRSRYELLAEALTAKAQALASGLITNVSQPIPTRRPEPISVTYDYRTGIKTVAYTSGALDEEPFDLAAMRSLPAGPGIQ
jgi:hypothetical protein